jgi:hypothetical protein
MSLNKKKPFAGVPTGNNAKDPIFKRPGRFAIPIKSIEERPEVVFMIQQHVLIRSVQPIGPLAQYFGFSMAFFELNQGEKVPSYEIQVLPPEEEGGLPRLKFIRLKERRVVAANMGDMNNEVRKLMKRKNIQ